MTIYIAAVCLPRTIGNKYCISIPIPNWQNPVLFIYMASPLTRPVSLKDSNSTMPMFVRANLRASTSEQDAQRARDMLDRFAHEHNAIICNYYAEKKSGARLERPELFRLLNDSRPGDVLLIEDVDRLSRLKGDEWEKLKAIIRQRGVWVVAVNVPTTWQHLSPRTNEFNSRMFVTINDMLLDMLAAIARCDYEQRRERQQQGITKAKAATNTVGGRSINLVTMPSIGYC